MTKVKEKKKRRRGDCVKKEGRRRKKRYNLTFSCEMRWMYFNS